jgi:hypothetical protein
LTAQYEAQAAEDRSSFPYRATLEIKGDHTLHPNMPIYLEGVGAEYETFWTILSVEHVVKEVSRTLFMYTTRLIVGTDSLGTSVTWSDNKQVIKPSVSPTRTILPNVTQTVVIPETKLSNTGGITSSQLSGSLGVLKNRSGSLISSPTWVTGTTTLNPILTPIGSQAPILNPTTLLGTGI